MMCAYVHYATTTVERVSIKQYIEDKSSVYITQQWPLTDLSETFLAGPHRCVDDLEEELTGPRIEDEDGSIDRLGRQVALECLPKFNNFSTTVYQVWRIFWKESLSGFQIRYPIMFLVVR